MYSNKRDEPTLCRDCKAVLIQWRPNPDKIGQIKPNGKPYVLPYEVNTGQKHDCPVFKQRMEQQPRNPTYVARVDTTRPPFTQNDQTSTNILEELKEAHRQRNTQTELLIKIADYLEALMKTAIEKEAFQNRTAYVEDQVEDPETTKQF